MIKKPQIKTFSILEGGNFIHLLTKKIQIHRSKQPHMLNEIKHNQIYLTQVSWKNKTLLFKFY
jgi:hypothetical protein